MFEIMGNGATSSLAGLVGGACISLLASLPCVSVCACVVAHLIMHFYKGQSHAVRECIFESLMACACVCVRP